MAWLSQNWILVVAGIVLLVVLLRAGASRSRHADQKPPADAQGGTHGQHKSGKHHGGHGCC